MSAVDAGSKSIATELAGASFTRRQTIEPVKSVEKLVVPTLAITTSVAKGLRRVEAIIAPLTAVVRVSEDTVIQFTEQSNVTDIV